MSISISYQSSLTDSNLHLLPKRLPRARMLTILYPIGLIIITLGVLQYKLCPPHSWKEEKKGEKAHTFTTPNAHTLIFDVNCTTSVLSVMLNATRLFTYFCSVWQEKHESCYPIIGCLRSIRIKFLPRACYYVNDPLPIPNHYQDIGEFTRTDEIVFVRWRLAMMDN